jgi:glyceraldehyde-3-phosphate dehydrogenase/erythrose-4-phosphate dehydrogenase
MSTRVAINGFGRIGRAVLRSAIEREAELDIVDANLVLGVNFDDVYDPERHHRSRLVEFAERVLAVVPVAR